MTTGRTLFAAAVLLPSLAAANGGPSRWAKAQTEGAVLPGDGGALSGLTLIHDESVECVSEDLTLALGADDATVRVEYVLLNHGSAKRIDYAFPFAIGEQETLVDGQVTRKTFGKPRAYALAVDGKKVPSREQRGLPVPVELPVPTIDDNEGLPDLGEWSPPVGGRAELGAGTRVENRYRFTYFVSPLELPAGRSVKLTVTYATPYLFYAKRSEIGVAKSPPSLSYLLSTGAGWRGGQIGRLKIVVRAPPEGLARYRVEGLPFERDGDVATFEAQDFTPTIETNLFAARSDFETVELARGPGAPADGLAADGTWSSAPITAGAPGFLRLVRSDPSRSANASPALGMLPGGLARFRLGLVTEAGSAQPARVRVELELPEGGRDAFQATFGEAAPAAIASAGSIRFIYFDAPARPAQLRLTFLEVRPAASGDRGLHVKRVVLEQDATNYSAYVPLPR